MNLEKKAFVNYKRKDILRFKWKIKIITKHCDVGAFLFNSFKEIDLREKVSTCPLISIKRGNDEYCSYWFPLIWILHIHFYRHVMITFGARAKWNYCVIIAAVDSMLCLSYILIHFKTQFFGKSFAIVMSFEAIIMNLCCLRTSIKPASL